MAGKVVKKKTIEFHFSEKHKEYIRRCQQCSYNVAEGAVRAGKTVDNIFAFAHELKTTPDRIHLATGSTVGNAKLNIGDCNGLGLEWIFRGQCHWGKYKDNEALFVKGPSTSWQQKIVIFAGGGKEDSYKKIRGNSYGMWIATEINLHHDKTIKEAFNRQLAAKRLKVFWDLNPDNPRAAIYSEYIDRYQKQQEAGEFPGGYNYMHCTIYDNINITPERLHEIESRYDVNSIWFLRDIKGMRVVATGLIYRRFADDITAGIGTFRIQGKPTDLMEINLGIDFGGSGSGHSFTATAITRSYHNVVALASEWIRCKDESGNQIEIDPQMLGDMFCNFVRKVLGQYGYITTVYADSAEQTLIAGIRSSLRHNGLGWIRVENALKAPINDRINAVLILMAQGRFQYVEGECESLVNALCTAVWDPKELTKNVRLDDGTSDIDSLDSFEYTLERRISQLIKYG
ncbi:PBSX family phage terminase large subunit [Clostridium sp. AF35-15]|jgi:PBSX family phage terminase large subunit|uniref:PBSX family phage terminase large subunit n=1 Tax=unclassified Clostridium TaxID=2614128 RepID=UPI000E46BE24|nr:PBSX family phage terminase large subunit [Clostridium sp. AF35-15]RHP14926.1 PBSX family phage terminase large subunit [Clostridium sp. AF35-15]RHQ85379.1 PBSX family phage terminase large subunit [Clostridium sp. AF22-10]DAX05220.1 MAG TPA: large terminase [Bacteriophage sp.]